MSCSDGIILLYVVHSVVQLPEAEFLESLKSYPPCYLKNSTSTSLPRDLYFFKLAQPLQVSTGNRIRRKPERKPYPPSLRFKKSIQKPQVRELSRNLNEIVHCTFMNSASGQPFSGRRLAQLSLSSPAEQLIIPVQKRTRGLYFLSFCASE